MKIKKRMLAILLSICFMLSLVDNFTNIPVAKAQEDDIVVDIPDINLRIGLLKALRFLDGNYSAVERSDAQIHIFTKSELARIEELSPEVCAAHNPQEGTVKIADLTGIEYCTNLKKLSLVNQRITNLSPLKNLINLEYIDLRNNIENDKAITDISPLENLVNLKTLNLDQSNIKDTKPLEKLVKLENLYLFGVKLTDMEFVKNMVNLKFLDLSYSRVSDITPIKNCKNIQVLKLSKNPKNEIQKDFERISDISALENSLDLRELYLSVNDITDISYLKKLKNLEVIDVSNNKVSNFEPFFELDSLSELGVIGNVVKLENDIKYFKTAKSFYEKLSKDNLDKEDISIIDDLLNQSELVRNYFSKETLEKLEEYREYLKYNENINNELFNDIKSDNLKGELVKIYNKKLTTTVGSDISNKLPSNLKVKIKKDKEEIVGKIYEENKYDVLSFAIVDENGNLVTEPINFKTKSGKNYTTKDGYFVVNKDMVSVVNYINTVFYMDSDKYEMIDKYLKVAKCTAYQLRLINDEDLSELSFTELAKKLVIKVRTKGTEDVIIPEPIPTPDVPEPTPIVPTPDVKPELQDKKVGIRDGKLYVKVVDENGKNVTENISFEFKSDHEAKLKPILEDDIFAIDIGSSQYIYNLNFESTDYKLVGRYNFSVNVGFSIETYEIEVKIGSINFNGEYKNLNGLSDEEIKNLDEKYFTIRVNSNSKDENTYSLAPKFTNSRTFLTSETIDVTNLKSESLTLEESDLIERVLPVRWDFSTLGTEVGEYIVYGDLVLAEGVRNPKNLRAKALVILKEKAQQPQETNNEALGELIKSENDILKIAIIDKDFNLVTEPIQIIENNSMNSILHISKDGYIEVDVKNGKSSFEILKDGYGIYKNLVYIGYGPKLMDINGKFLNEISEVGLRRQLRIQIGKLNSLYDEQNGVKVESAVISDVIKLHIEKIKDKEINEYISDIYEIYLADTKGEKIDFINANFIITIKNRIGNRPIKVYSFDGNKYEEVDFTQYENHIVFVTTKFSKYVLAYEKEENNILEDDKNSGNVGTTKPYTKNYIVKKYDKTITYNNDTGNNLSENSNNESIKSVNTKNNISKSNNTNNTVINKTNEINKDKNIFSLVIILFLILILSSIIVVYSINKKKIRNK